MHLLSRLLITAMLCIANSVRADETSRVVTTDAVQPHVAIDDGGGIYVVFIRRGNVEMSVSTDRGKTFSEPVVAIDAKGRAKGGKHRGPRIGVDARKQLTITCPIVLDETERQNKYPTAELVLVRSSDGGKSWSQPIQVNEVVKQAPEALHWMVVAPSGECHIAWLDRRGRSEPGQDLYYARVENGKVGKNQKVATTICECCAPGLAVDAKGNPAIVFREGGSKPSREIFAVRSTNKGDSFGKPYQINQAPTLERGCPMSAPAVAVSPDGKNFAAAWKDLGSGQPRIHWARGASAEFAGDAPIGDTPSGRQDHPSMTRDANGLIWIAWEEKIGDSQQIWVCSMAKKGLAHALSESSQGRASFPSIASNAGLTGVAYEVNKDGRSAIVFRNLESLVSAPVELVPAER